MGAKYVDEYVQRLAARTVAANPMVGEADDVAQELRIGWWRAELAGYDGPLGVHFALKRLRKRGARSRLAQYRWASQRSGYQHYVEQTRSAVDPEAAAHVAACIRKVAAVVSPAAFEVLVAAAAGATCAEIAQQQQCSVASGFRKLDRARAEAIRVLGEDGA